MQKAFFFTAIFFIVSCHSIESEISQINFEADFCFGTCPIFEMSIQEDGTAFYNAISYNKLEGKFRTIIHKPQLDSLKTQISKANIFTLNNNYSIAFTDHPTYILTVKLKNGRTKTIKDYGPAGPKKLKLVYGYIFSLRESQDWK